MIEPAKFPLAGAPDFVTPANGSLASLLTGTNVVVTQNLLKLLSARLGDMVIIHTQAGRVVEGKISGVIKNSGLFQGTTALVDLASFSALPSTSNLPVSYPAVYTDVPGHTDALRWRP